MKGSAGFEISGLHPSKHAHKYQSAKAENLSQNRAKPQFLGRRFPTKSEMRLAAGGSRFDSTAMT